MAETMRHAREAASSEGQVDHHVRQNAVGMCTDVHIIRSPRTDRVASCKSREHMMLGTAKIVRKQ